MSRPSTLCTLLRLPPRAWQLPVLLLTALMTAACSSSSSKIQGVPSNLSDIPLYGSAATPPHSMSRGDYPFDSNGNYMTAWAAQGGSSSPGSYISGHSEEMPPEPAPRKDRANRTKVESMPPPTRSRVENAPPEIKSSYSASGGRRTSDEPATRKGGAPKPSLTTKSKGDDTPAKKKVADSGDKPGLKKKTSSGGTTKHIVKSTDTLAGIAKKYGTTEKKLKAANGLKSDVIRDGRALVIPK